MNKIFSTLWNASPEQLIVVSKLAGCKSGSGSSGARRARRQSGNGLADRSSASGVASLPALGWVLLVPLAVSLMLVSPHGHAAIINADTTCSQASGPGAVIVYSNPGTTSHGGTDGTPDTDGSGTYSLVAGCDATGNDQLAVTAFGAFSNADGRAASAFGNQASAGANWTTAVGAESQATGAGSIALGAAAVSSGLNSVAIGGPAASASGVRTQSTVTTASAEGAIAIGGNSVRGAQATAADAIAIGGESSASGVSSVAVGNASNASTDLSIAIGDTATTGQKRDIAIGVDTNTGAISSAAVGQLDNVAMGKSAQAYGGGSVAIGQGTLATGTNTGGNNNALAVGSQAEVHDYNGVALGTSATTGVGSTYATAIGSTAQIADNASGAVAIGSNATVAEGASRALAMGAGSNAAKYGASALGTSASASGEHSVAVGDTSKAYNTASIAVGYNSVAGVNGGATTNDIAIGNAVKATGGSSVALGDGAQASGANSLSIGADNNVSGDNSGAIGDPNTITGAGSYAVGNDNTIGANNAFVLGNSVTNNVTGSVVLGNDSTVANAVSTSSATINGTTYNFAGATPVSTVSVGAAGSERTITNVAAGRISDTSTDAINGSQLYGTNQAITDVAGKLVHYYSVNSTTTGTGSNYANDGATGGNALAAGLAAQATGSDTVAIGHSAVASGPQSIAIGLNASTAPNNTIAIGNGAHVDGASDGFYNAIAIGTGAQAGAGDTAKANWNSGIAIGYQADARTMTNPGDTGKTNTSPVAIGWQAWAQGNGSQVAIGDRTQASGIDAIAIGGHADSPGAQATGDYSTAVGPYAQATGDNTLALGKLAKATQESALAIGNNAISNVTGGVAIGNNSSTNGVVNGVALGVSSVAGAAHTGTTATQVTLGGTTYTFAGPASAANGTVSVGTAGHERQIQYVAAGDITAASTDAVNGSQLYASNQALKSNIAGTAVHYYSVNSTTTGTGSNYANDGATGADALAAGVNASAAGDNSVAVGVGSSTDGLGTVAIGKDAVAQNSAGGGGVGSSNAGSVAIGDASQAIGSNNVAVGSRAAAIGSNGSSAFGVQASASGISATSIGLLSSAAGENAVAVGTTAQAYGDDSIAAGRDSVAGVSGSSTTITNDIAIGTGAQATGGDSIALGSGSLVSGANSGAFGDPNNVTGSASYAFGNDNTIANDNTFVVGNGVTTTQDNSVVLGNASTDGAPHTGTTAKQVTLAGTTYTYAGPAAAAAGMVSVGSAGAERQIQNVAAGDITASSTDAVNGSQLYATNQAIGDISDFAVKYDDDGTGNPDDTKVTLGGPASTDGGATGGTTITNVHQGDVSDTSTDAVNGSQLYATNQNVSSNTTQITTNTGDIGDLQTTVAKPITFSGNDDTNGPVTAQLGDTVAIQGGATTTGSYSDANIKTVTNSTTGSVDIQLADNPVFTSLTTGDTTIDDDGLTITGGPSVTKAGIDAGSNKITNVAAGTADTDAVNVSQLGTAVAGATTHYYSVNDGGTHGDNYINDGAAGTGALAAGVNAESAADSGVAIGNGAMVDAVSISGIAIGTDAKAVAASTSSLVTATAIGKNATANAGVAIGNKAVAGTLVGDGVTYGYAIGSEAQATGQKSVALGDKTVADHQYSVAIGSGAESTGQSAIAQGVGAQASGLSSLAIGQDTTAGGANAVVMGHEAAASGNNAIAVGHGANASDTQSIAIGWTSEASAPGALALGVASKATKQTSVVVGYNSQVNGEGSAALGYQNVINADSAFVLGSNVTNGVTGSVVLGNNSTVEAPVATSSVDINGETYSFAGSKPVSTVSVGADGTERTITHVAAGRISSTSTDAINGSQLHATNQAIEAVSGTANAGWNLSANGGTGVNIAPGATVDVSPGSSGNITVTQDGTTGDLTVDTNPDLAATSVTTGDTTVDNSGVTINDGTIPVSLTNTGLDNGGNKIVNVAPGTLSDTSTDVVNGSQLYATNQNVANNTTQITTNTGDISDLQTTVAQPITFSGNDDANGPVTAQLGDTAAIQGGATTTGTYSDGNIKTVTNSSTGAVDIQLADNPAFTSLTTGDTTIDNDGLTVTGGPSITKTGIDAGGNKITNVVAGTADTDAVNVSQLGTAVAGATTHYYSVNDGGTQGANYNNDGATGLNALAAGVGASAHHSGDVAIGAGANSFSGTSGAGNIAIGQNASANDSSGGNGVTALGAGAQAGTGGFTGATALGAKSTATQNSTAVGYGASSAANGTALGKGAQTTSSGTVAVGVGAKATFVGATAIGASSVASGMFSFAGGTKAEASGDSAIAIGKLPDVSGDNSIGVGVSATVSGANSGAFGNNNTIANANTFVLGNGVTTTQDNSVVLGNASTDGAPHTGTTARQVTLAGTTYTYAGPAAATAGMVSVGSAGAERQIQNVAAGDITASSTDAVNGSQLYATNQAVGDVSDFAVKYDDDGTGNPDYTKITLGGPTSTDGGATGGTTITNVHQGDVSDTSTDAVNGSQLYAVQQTASAGWNVGVNGDTATQVKPGDNVDFSNSTTDGNIKIAKTDSGTDHDITFDLADDINVDSVTAGNTVINNTGVTIGSGANQVSLTNTGLDNGGNVIQNVASGGTTTTNAANIGDVNNAVAAAETHYFSVDDGGTQEANYQNDGASGTNAIAIGPNASASADESLALGDAATATYGGAVAIGQNASASAGAALAVGTNAIASGTSSMAVGNGVEASGGQAVAFGNVGLASGDFSTAVGNDAHATNQWATALGVGSHAAGSKSIALGRTAATGADAISIGTSTRDITKPAGQQFTVGGAFGDRSVAIGKDARAKGNYTIAMGNDGVTGADAEGANAIALGGASVAGSATAGEAVAIGHGAQATGGSSIALGNGAQASGANSLSIGVGNSVSGDNSGAIGDPSTVTGAGSYSIGNNNTIGADNAFVLGNNVTNNVDGSVVLGNNSTVAAAVGTASTTINGTTYNFAGATPVSTISVGAAGAERTITNVAAGRISDSSTDAINGSQLYATNQAIGDVSDFAVKYDDDGTGNPDYTKVTLGGPTSTDGGATGGTTITNVHQGDVSDTSTDAVNGSQLYAVQQTASAGWNVGVNGDTATQVKPGDSVDFSNTDGNLTIAKTDSGTDHDITLDLADDINVDSVTAGNTVINNTGVTIGSGANQVSLTNTGLDNGGNKIMNVAAGTISTSSTDAINGSQMQAAGDSLSTVLGGDAQYDGATNSYTMTNIGGTGEDNINDAIAAANSAATAGWNLTAQGANSSNVGPNEAVDLNNSDGNIVVSKTTASNDVTFNLADNINIDSVTTGNSTLDTNGLTVDDGAGNKTNVNAGQVTVAGDSGDKITIDGGTGTINGLTNTTWDPNNVTSDQAATEGQLQDLNTLINKHIEDVANTIGAGWNVDTGAVGSGVHEGDGTHHIGPKEHMKLVAGDNLKVEQDGGQITFALQDNINVDSVMANTFTAGDSAGNKTVITSMGTVVTNASGGSTHYGSDGLYFTDADGNKEGPSVSRDGIDAGGQRITNVKAGKNPTDAVNMQQLNSFASDINQGFSELNDKINDVGERADAGVASAMAMANLPQAYIPGQGGFTGGVGYFHGESAIALGASAITDNGRYVFKASITQNTQGDTGAGAGVFIVW